MRTPEVNTLVVPFDVVGETQTFEFSLSSEEYSFGIDSAVQIMDTADLYNGPYVVEPDWEAQTLATRDKTMADNVTIEGIYVARVANSAGGKTVYIGGEIIENG